MAGTKLLYRRSADTWESFEVPGPTQEDLHIMVSFKMTTKKKSTQFLNPSSQYNCVHLFWSDCRSCPLIRTLGLNMSTGCLQTATPCIMGDVNFGSLTTHQTTCPLNFPPLRLQLLQPQPLQQHSQSQNLISGVKTFHSWYLGIKIH